MSHATMREHIKAEVDHLDPAALQTIWEIIGRARLQPATVLEPAVGSTPNRADKTAGSSPSLQFVGENLTLAEYESLPLEERGMLQRRLREQNCHWLQENFLALDAAWLVVINGKIIASGKSLNDKPRQPQILEIYRRTGKFPFVFVNDRFITVEESAASWHETKKVGDYYPTLPATFSSASGIVHLVGDLDTGASQTFVDYDFLAAQNIIHPEAGDYSESHSHLNQAFEYIDKLLHIELSSSLGGTRTIEAWVCCVPKWHRSPFVAINPHRLALLGRDILLELKPRVLLDFEKRQTEIVASMASNQPS